MGECICWPDVQRSHVTFQRVRPSFFTTVVAALSCADSLTGAEKSLSQSMCSSQCY